MKRDPDLIRRIAFEVEALEHGKLLVGIDGVDSNDFAEHVALMLEAGLVKASVSRSMDLHSTKAEVYRLTWSGFDFLDAARSDTLWNKAKESVIRPTASWTFDILKEWLKTEIKNGLPTLGSLAG